MGRPTNRTERRREILDAFRQVVATSGYERATIALTAERAGLLPGLVHYHFENKQELLTALFEELADGLVARYTALKAGGDGGPRGDLDAFVAAHLGLGADADESSVAAWVALSGEALHNEELLARLEARIAADLAVLEDIVKRILEAEGKRKAGAKVVAAAIFSAIQGAFFLGVATPRLIPRGFAAPAIQRWAQRMVDDGA